MTKGEEVPIFLTAMKGTFLLMHSYSTPGKILYDLPLFSIISWLFFSVFIVQTNYYKFTNYHLPYQCDYFLLQIPQTLALVLMHQC
jgi:predicted AlkP superfamily pyrophosphatase or phosphodiesterase